MIPAKEKANELFNKLNDKIISFEDVRLRGNGFEMTKRCALIAVDEILESHNKFLSGNNTLIYKYYQEVKSEIELL